MSRSEDELRPAPNSLFQRRPLRLGGHVDAQSREAVFMLGNQPPHRLARHEECIVRRADAPTLTVTSDPHNSVAVIGGSLPDWNVRFSAEARGQTEAEADQRLQRCLFTVTGSTVSITGPGLYDGHDTRSELLVEAPHDAGVVIHGSYAAVEVRDMAGPVRIAATHARATILDTTGPVDATAGCVDFAGSCGRITLSAEAEINLKITAREFHGTLLAWGQRSVRMLIPPEFDTPIEVIVGNRDDFVCRAEFRSDLKQNRLGELYVFSYGVSADDRLEAGLHLRSEASTVVIDPW
jgi:hypothetical protein